MCTIVGELILSRVDTLLNQRPNFVLVVLFLEENGARVFVTGQNHDIGIVPHFRDGFERIVLILVNVMCELVGVTTQKFVEVFFFFL